MGKFQGPGQELAPLLSLFLIKCLVCCFEICIVVSLSLSLFCFVLFLLSGYVFVDFNSEEEQQKALKRNHEYMGASLSGE